MHAKLFHLHYSVKFAYTISIASHSTVDNFGQIGFHLTVIHSYHGASTQIYFFHTHTQDINTASQPASQPGMMIHFTISQASYIDAKRKIWKCQSLCSAIPKSLNKLFMHALTHALIHVVVACTGISFHAQTWSNDAIEWENSKKKEKRCHRYVERIRSQEIFLLRHFFISISFTLHFTSCSYRTNRNIYLYMKKEKPTKTPKYHKWVKICSANTDFFNVPKHKHTHTQTLTTQTHI